MLISVVQQSESVIHIHHCCLVARSCLTLWDPMECVVCQASLSFTISWSLLKLMSTELVMPSNHLIFCCSLSSCPQYVCICPLFLDSFPIQFSSICFSHSLMSDSLRPHGLQHGRPPCPSPTPGVYSNLCSLSQ